MMGDISDWITKDYQFVIERCNNTKLKTRTNGRLKCKNGIEIDAYISHVQIDTWVRNL